MQWNNRQKSHVTGNFDSFGLVSERKNYQVTHLSPKPEGKFCSLHTECWHKFQTYTFRDGQVCISSHVITNNTFHTFTWLTQGTTHTTRLFTKFIQYVVVIKIKISPLTGWIFNLQQTFLFVRFWLCVCVCVFLNGPSCVNSITQTY